MADRRAQPSNRPLSPFLGIYRWPITMATSILHRVTGFGLALGTLLLAWWLIAAASGPEAYETFQAAANHWSGRLVLFGFTLALVYHTLNGIRHLFWDFGHGYKTSTANRTGILVFALTAASTVAIWAAAYQVMGKL